MSRWICVLLLSAVVGLIVAGAISADEPSDASVTLRPGLNIVTWSGSEPYAITNFAETPVRTVHRFDAVRQKWLSRFVGQDEATLPELHLLPRVQYLLKSDAAHELTIPNPLAGIDPLARLRFPAAPNDPLHFEAYWPNEDSPLEDLVVLRGEDERLSVEAWVAGGEGDVSVWWVIDGQISHVGLESDDVDLLPGGHDHGRLYATSATGEVEVVALPRVVKLPTLASLDLPDMRYGAVPYLTYVFGPRVPTGECIEGWLHLCAYAGNWNNVLSALDLIAAAGFEIIRLETLWGTFDHGPAGINEDALNRYVRIIEEAYSRGIQVLPQIWWTPDWAASELQEERGSGGYDLSAPSSGDPNNYGRFAGLLAERLPQIRFWQFLNEPNSTTFYSPQDPVTAAKEIKAGMLAVCHVNPDCVIVGPALSPWRENTELVLRFHQFLQEMFDAGVNDYVDVFNLTFYGCPSSVTPAMDDEWLFWHLDEYRRVMAANGAAHKQFWVTEFGPGSIPTEEEQTQARCMVVMFEELTQRNDVHAVFIHTVVQGADAPWQGNNAGFGLVDLARPSRELAPKPSYWAIREYLTGKPPP